VRRTGGDMRMGEELLEISGQARGIGTAGGAM
jgi:hypothetical protein